MTLTDTTPPAHKKMQATFRPTTIIITITMIIARAPSFFSGSLVNSTLKCGHCLAYLCPHNSRGWNLAIPVLALDSSLRDLHYWWLKKITIKNNLYSARLCSNINAQPQRQKMTCASNRRNFLIISKEAKQSLFITSLFPILIDKGFNSRVLHAAYTAGRRMHLKYCRRPSLRN